jgi:hypothetical protein
MNTPETTKSQSDKFKEARASFRATMMSGTSRRD